MGRGRVVFAWGLLVTLGLAAGAGGCGKRRHTIRNVYDLEQDVVAAGTSIDICLTKDGTGFKQSVAASYYPWRHFGAGLGWGYAVGPDDSFFPGNLQLWAVTGLGSKVKDGFGAYIDLDAHAGLSTSAAGDEGVAAAAQMAVTDAVGWLGYLPGSAVLGLDLYGALFLNQTVLSASVGTDWALPIYDGQQLAQRVGITYAGSLVFCPLGDHRGSFCMAFGAYGLQELSAAEEHQLGLGGSIQVRLGDLGLRFYLGASAPMMKHNHGLAATIFSGVAWRIDARPQKPDRRDPLPPGGATALRGLLR